jgi:hypothetical protein
LISNPAGSGKYFETGSKDMNYEKNRGTCR